MAPVHRALYENNDVQVASHVRRGSSSLEEHCKNSERTYSVSRRINCRYDLRFSFGLSGMKYMSPDLTKLPTGRFLMPKASHSCCVNTMTSLPFPSCFSAFVRVLRLNASASSGFHIFRPSMGFACHFRHFNPSVGSIVSFLKYRYTSKRRSCEIGHPATTSLAL